MRRGKGRTHFTAVGGDDGSAEALDVLDRLPVSRHGWWMGVVEVWEWICGETSKRPRTRVRVVVDGKDLNVWKGKR